MKLSEYFEKANTKNIIINSDIDGFISGMLLQKYYNCKVVGFSNSKESIWMTPDIKSLDNPIYIDIYISKSSVFCIDQHIVAKDLDHLKRILAYGTKLNPNLDIAHKTFEDDYYRKYPFGTSHYLMAIMKQDGFDDFFDNLEQKYRILGKYELCPAEIILRADDAMYSSLGRYEENAREWWGRLKSFNSNTIDELVNYLNKCDKSKNFEYKQNIGEFFVSGLQCDGKDGAFETITKSDGKTLQDRIIKYNDILGKILGLKMDLPDAVEEYKGVACRGRCTEKALKDAYTYAFIYGPTKKECCFSYTIMSKAGQDIIEPF